MKPKMIKGYPYYPAVEVTSRKLKAFKEGYNKAIDNMWNVPVSYFTKEGRKLYEEFLKKLKKKSSKESK
jgi:hypothetical protein